jgi:hypothetical protein
MGSRYGAALLVLLVTGFHGSYAHALDKTATGFYYPTGTSALGSYAGWLAKPPAYFDGYYHLGKDIAAPVGAGVYAVSSGTVVRVSYNGWGDGNVALLVRHRISDGSSRCPETHRGCSEEMRACSARGMDYRGTPSGIVARGSRDDQGL